MISYDEIIDGDTRYAISDVLSDILVQQEIDAVHIGYNYKVSKTLLFVFVNYYKENDNNRYQTLVVYDFVHHLTIYVESLLAIEKGDQNISQYMIDDVSNYILLNQQDDIVYIYKYTDSEVTKDEYVLSDTSNMTSMMTMTTYNHIFIRYSIENEEYKVIDAIDYEHQKLYEAYLNIDLINEKKTLNINHQGTEYIVDIDDHYILSIKDLAYQTYFESEIIELYDSSNVGQQVIEICAKLDIDDEPEDFDYFLTEKDIYVLFRFRGGLFMNNSFFGKTPYLIFRFDFDTLQLIYIGLEDGLHGIYHEE